jgi:hypothetical protein
MATIKQLIEQLQQVEDQDQQVIFQYYTKENFEYGDDETEVSDEVFEEAVDWAEKVNVWEDAFAYLNDHIYDKANASTDEDEDEDES